MDSKHRVLNRKYKRNYLELVHRIGTSGYKIYQKLGWKRATYYKRINNLRSLEAQQLIEIANCLGLSHPDFFCEVYIQI